jgi:hypothetical protein
VSLLGGPRALARLGLISCSDSASDRCRSDGSPGCCSAEGEGC